MAASDILLHRRNTQDNGWEDVQVTVTQNGFLRTNVSKNPTVSGPAGTATALATAGAGTYTAALITSGIITRDPNGASRTDTTDTAAAILTAAQVLGLLMNDYEEMFFYVINTADAAETITLAGGTSVTLQGIGTIAQNSMDKFCLFRTSSTTLVMRKA